MKVERVLPSKILSYFIRTLLLFQFALASASEGAGPYIGYSDYHILTDFSFPYSDYFAEMQKSRVNFQRIWVIGYANSVPSIREKMPFVRVGKKYDLMRIDPAFLERLRNVLKEAKSREQTVTLTLFDHWSMSNLDSFIRTPWYYKNNKQRLLGDPMPDFHDVKNRMLMKVQENYVRTIVRATKEFHPVYEIMNEARVRPDCSPAIGWHHHVAKWILDEFQEAEVAVNVHPSCEELHEADWVDVISLHYGQWEAGICEAIQNQPPGKTVIIDTDGGFKYRDDNRLVKKWLREALACGGSFNHKDEIRSLDRDVLRILSATKLEF